MPTSDSETDIFVTIARHQIVAARIRLTEQHVTPVEAHDLWRLVDGIESVIKMRVRSFEVELEQIDREIERRLRRS